MIDNEYLKQSEVAEILGVKIETLNHWRCVKKHNILYIKVGRVILYPKVNFYSWLENHSHNKSNNEIIEE